MENSYAAIVQVRLGSTRFPEKVIKDINGRTMIELNLKVENEFQFGENLNSNKDST